MKIYIGSDHNGFGVKEFLKKKLPAFGYEIIDCGNAELDKGDDYPQFAFVVGEVIAKEKDALGVLICGSGEGVCMAANKILGVRAASVRTTKEATLTREHNHTNVLCLGANELTTGRALELVKAFLEAIPSKEKRHIRRVEQIAIKEKKDLLDTFSLAQSRRQIIPAILETDFGSAEKKLKQLSGLVSWVQIDVMDGAFVPSTSFDLAQLTDQVWPFLWEVHLMVDDPLAYLKVCKSLGVKRVLVHIESKKFSLEVLQSFRREEIEIGLVINPVTDVDMVEFYRDEIDRCMVMGVVPGKSGQSMSPETFNRIKELREKLPSSVALSVDGGVNANNIQQLLDFGIDGVCIGSALWADDDVRKSLLAFRKFL